MKYEQMTMMSYTLARGAWGKNPDIRKLCELAVKLGLKTVDWVTTYNIKPAEIRKICDDYNLRTVCYTFFADINFPERTARQAGIDAIRAGIETALVLGTDKIMLPIGGKEGLTRQESRRNVIEGLKDAVRAGEENGVSVTVEHFPQCTAPFITSSDVNEAVRAVPSLRITYDSGNVLTGGEDPADGFLKSREYIIHSHFKDWAVVPEGKGMRGCDGRYYRGALVGEGALEYKKILQAMHRSGYEGYVDFEYEGSDYTPEEAMEKGLRYLKEIFETLE